MKTTTFDVSTILSLAVTALPLLSASNTEQCLGLDPQPGVATYLGATLDYGVADRICCHNHVYAEYSGYLEAPEVDLFGRLDPEVETVFYDSVCGIPLFIAPRGRSFEEFKRESLVHGWPSFRPEEIVSENVIIHDGGRMESRCLTHLGHNLPSGGVDRYCIDLVCIAGSPLSTSNETSQMGTDELAQMANGEVEEALSTANNGGEEEIITADKLDTSTYVSSAEQFSGKHSKTGRNIMVAAFTILPMIVAGVAVYHFRHVWTKKKGKQLSEIGEGGAGVELGDNSSGTKSIEELS